MSKTYHICRFIRGVFGRKRPYTTAIILAGGVGSRMQRKDGQTKQMLPLCGIPVLIHTMRAFEVCPYIDDIVVVAREEEVRTVQAMLSIYTCKKIRCVVPGGATRQLSALSGFEAIDEKKCKFVAIHDAARCLVTEGQISDVVATAYATRAAAAASRVYDTVKRVDKKGYARETLDRETLWLAATPQVFSVDLYRTAAYAAQKDGYEVTDDMMLCERIGQAVRLIDCGTENFKITTDTDLLRAEVVLRSRSERKK